jgi:hypothetical protein
VTQADAVAAAGRLRTALLDNGVRAVSIELQQGAGGSGWGVAPFKRGLGHHIVSRPPGTPGLALVKKGRPDLAGPLCNGYGGFDLTARIITMSYANHPGLGGPWAVPGWGTVPVNNGRPYIFGWEFEGGIVEWTDAMHDFMARCGAGTLDWLGTLPGNPGPAPLDCWGEHKTWAPGRKIDRLNYTTASGRSRIAAVRGKAAPTPTDEDDMFETDDRKTLNNVAVLLSQHLAPAIGRVDAALGGNKFEWLRAQIATEVTEALESVQTGGVDADAIADRIAERLRARLEA